ncbi:MAG: alpha/beta fold hydrolase, partial [Solirubrobacteraceae bacterium]
MHIQYYDLMITGDLTYKVHQIEVSNGNKCAIHQIYKNHNGIPVIMVHGFVENSKIFFSTNGKGFAPFLARNNFNVFVLDLPGKGSSKPKITSNFISGMFEFINIDLNIIFDFIKSLLPHKSNEIIGVAHSWGGVLLLSNYAKYAERNELNKFILFGVK